MTTTPTKKLASFEQIFNSSILNLIVPNAILELPTQDIDQQVWLAKLRSEESERERAFFDEFLDFFVVLYLAGPDEAPVDPAHPPSALLSFLAHTQVSYDAAYISPISPSTHSAPQLGTPPRTMSLKSGGGNGGLHVPPSIFPPNTPNPTPLTTEQDRRYVRADGVALVSGMWGEGEDLGEPRRIKNRDAFALLWDEASGMWVAVYQMCINIAFLRLPVGDPLLCLTASITVRERPMPITPARAVFAAILKEADDLPGFSSPPLTQSSNNAYESDKFYHGIDEANLLEGLSSAPTFANSPLLSLPSTRISAKIREQDFALQSDPSSMVDESMTTPLVARATLRKSFRRTLSAVSGFRVRMRTVFVPYNPHCSSKPDAELDYVLADGHADHTVMLCVELEHPGEAPEAFLVDAVDVTVGDGGGARVRLLPWCEESLQEIFPLRLGVHEQCNFLFAVELLNSPVSEKGASFVSDPMPDSTGELQRPITITVQGRPVSDVLSNGGQNGTRMDKLLFPTRPFPSRWNCVLDLTPQRPTTTGKSGSEVLPEPSTPFPATTPRLSTLFADQQSPQNAIASQKRFVLPSGNVPRFSRPSPGGTSGSVIQGAGHFSKLAYTPPSVTAAISGAPRTTYAPPPSAGIPPPVPLSAMLPMGETDEAFFGSREGTTPPPTTPAYPAYPKTWTFPVTPRTQVPLATSGVVRVPGTTLELPRSGAVSRSSPIPTTLGLVPFSSIKMQSEGIVVSVGLQDGTGRLIPYDEFVLDIFVFNQSAWARRFEVTFLERRRRRYGQTEGRGDQYSPSMRQETMGPSGAGIMSLESRVRVGPLRPATCQSVRMVFLALMAGVHTIEAITLTDIETQHVLTLRYSNASHFY